MLWSVFVINSAIVTLSSMSTSLADPVRKEKRGIFGFGAHGHHQHYPPHYDDYPPPIPQHYHQNVPGPAFPPHPPAPVNLGAHYHTTVTKKIGVPIPYPYPVKVKFLKRKRDCEHAMEKVLELRYLSMNNLRTIKKLFKCATRSKAK